MFAVASTTNCLENFWSLLKRGLRGTYVAVEPFHLERYVDEQVFRFNNRKDLDAAGRFSLAVSQMVGRRLKYADLTSKGKEPITEAWEREAGEAVEGLVKPFSDLTSE